MPYVDAMAKHDREAFVRAVARGIKRVTHQPWKAAKTLAWL
jgi:hypothetical protein